MAVRFTSKALCWAFAGAVGLDTALVGASYLCEDRKFDRMTARGQRLVLPNKSWLRKPSKNEISTAEEKCVNAVSNLLSFNLGQETLRVFAPNVVLHDSLFLLDGLGEIRDGWAFLSMFYTSSQPSLLSIVRPEGHPDELVLRYETEAVMKWTGISYTFPSSVRLKVIDHRPGEKRISAMEHRWFHGPLGSHRCFPNTFGTIGDLARRTNGFCLSTFLTQTEIAR